MTSNSDTESVDYPTTPDPERTKSPNHIRLSGLWDGQSLSTNGHATKWSNTTLIFEAPRSNETHATIKGHGVSRWREQLIEFDICGTINWSTCQLSIAKQHKGAYTNCVVYEAKVDLVKCVIRGYYQNGTISLTRRARALPLSPTPSAGRPIAIDALTSNDAPASASASATHQRQQMSVLDRLSGKWQGESLSAKNDPTEWRDTTLTFEVLENSTKRGRVLGNGWSVWRGQRIQFGIQGWFSLDENKVTLVKTHRGKYRNQVQYTGFLSESANGLYRITGMYSNGRFELAQVERSIKRRSSSFSSSTLTSPAAARDASPDPLSPLQLSKALSGIWEGYSQDKKGIRTEWDATALRFVVRDENSGTDDSESTVKMEIEGCGTSLWHKQKIDFDITGSLDISSHKLVVTKQHKGEYTNSIQYSSNLIVFSDSRGRVTYRVEGTYQSESGGGTLRLQHKRGLSTVTSLLRSYTDTKPRSKSDAVRMQDYKMFLLGLLLADGIKFMGGRQNALDEFRDKSGVSEALHERVLSELHYTKAEFTMLRETDTGPDNDAEMCKVCMAEQVNCVLVPCGHYVICRTCVKSLSKLTCPICRENIMKVQPVYRC